MAGTHPRGTGRSLRGIRDPGQIRTDSTCALTRKRLNSGGGDSVAGNAMPTASGDTPASPADLANARSAG